MAMMASRRCRVDIVTDDHGILAPEATGLGEFIQAARVVVAVDADSTSHVVVRAAQPPFLLDSDDDSIRKLFPDAIVSLVHADVPGQATISCSAASPGEQFAAAAAVATLKRSWGWDESPTIRITFETGGREFRLDPVFDDNVWWVDLPN